MTQFKLEQKFISLSSLSTTPYFFQSMVPWATTEGEELLSTLITTKSFIMTWSCLTNHTYLVEHELHIDVFHIVRDFQSVHQLKQTTNLTPCIKRHTYTLISTLSSWYRVLQCADMQPAFA